MTPGRKAEQMKHPLWFPRSGVPIDSFPHSLLSLASDWKGAKGSCSELLVMQGHGSWPYLVLRGTASKVIGGPLKAAKLRFTPLCFLVFLFVVVWVCALYLVGLPLFAGLCWFCSFLAGGFCKKTANIPRDCERRGEMMTNSLLL